MIKTIFILGNQLTAEAAGSLMLLGKICRDRNYITMVRGLLMMKKRLSLSTTHIIMLSFLVVILVGSLLLSLPISSANGEPVHYLDALFTATTSVCVTGLVTLPTVTTWSVFGQVVILLLIQIGGLGVITIMSAVMIVIIGILFLAENRFGKDVEG